MHSATYRHEISMAHRLVGHPRGCGRIHGHNYVIDIHASIAGNVLNSMSMVIDFGTIKQACGRWLDEHWDHRLVLYESDPLLDNPVVEMALQENGLVVVPFNPTAENMACILSHKFREVLQEGNLLPPDTQISVTVQETSHGWAHYEAVLEDNFAGGDA